MLFHIQRVEYGGESSIGGVRVVAVAAEITAHNDSLAWWRQQNADQVGELIEEWLWCNPRRQWYVDVDDDNAGWRVCFDDGELILKRYMSYITVYKYMI